MAFASSTISNVIFIRWQNVEQADIARLRAQVARTKAAHFAHGQLVYIAVVPPNLEPPDDAARKGLADAIPELLKHCCCVHLVLEGNGFKQAAMRTIAAGIFLLTGRRGQVHTHDSASDALGRCGNLTTPAAKIIGEARAQGLVTL